MESILASPINSYLTSDPNALKSFVMDELYSLSRNMNRIRTEYDQSIKNSGENEKD